MRVEPVLVDTSVWIDHLRGRTTAATTRLAHWLESDPDCILINEVVTTELLRGIGNETAAMELNAALSKLRQAPAIQIDDWQASARIYRRCRNAGLGVRSSMDCLIAAHAMRVRVSVLATDRDFDAITSCVPLMIRIAAAQ